MKLEEHPIIGQLKQEDRQSRDVDTILKAIEERSRIMDRDGKATTIVTGVVGISGLFFNKPLAFFLVLALLVVGLPLVWIHLRKEAREFTMTREEVEAVLGEIQDS